MCIGFSDKLYWRQTEYEGEGIGNLLDMDVPGFDVVILGTGAPMGLGTFMSDWPRRKDG